MAEVYYFISDLHIGGDEELQECAFEPELIEFLQTLEATDEDAELIINGDLFGLWEFTELQGMAKLDSLEAHHGDLFEQFRRTGEHVPITLIPGNHDAELAGYPEYVERLAEYNIDLQNELRLVRPVGSKKLWIEHGMQEDPNNRLPQFGNPFANPLGYFVNNRITGKAGQLSRRGKYNWLRDIQSVTPMADIPYWMISNYYYREMSPLLRYASVPFLLLFNVTLLWLAGASLERVGILNTNVFTNLDVFRQFGIVGDVFYVVVLVNLVVMGLLIALAIPAFFLGRDVKQTLRRFGLLSTERAAKEEDQHYRDAAVDVFASNPDVVAFIYGHTHRPSLKRLGSRAVINTGTWLKQFTRISTRFGVLPPVYRPSYCLNYFRITADEHRIVIDYDIIEKEAPSELTPLQRFLVRWKHPEPTVPPRTVLEPDEPRTLAEETPPVSRQPGPGRRPEA
ncbi:metallophosphoesterase [Haloarchaeobius sp. HME9146]|uniref:metallophosphoesterase n=1 Tax=Haloarchaeobius sp. HME9146 TaxID=2978732 RepID=UPI0021BFE92D|nr:metallophosphoesterase [Haloarchaeobius sp. HME9146]MCT9096853.1 metallophosphoesterase [Haloarchaeobius sp. HME9146]